VSRRRREGEMLMTEDNAMLRTLSPRSRPPSRTANSRVAGGRLHVVFRSFRCRWGASSSASRPEREASRNRWRLAIEAVDFARSWQLSANGAHPPDVICLAGRQYRRVVVLRMHWSSDCIPRQSRHLVEIEQISPTHMILYGL
jgi:hypothetical protein